jgi:CHAT domain-containing protein
MEIDQIAALFPRDSQAILLGPHAQKREVLERIGQARVLHFSCHGVSDSSDPFHSSLVLAPAEPGQAPDHLEAWEILELGPLNAEFVALSACRTALGREESGQGMLGLAHAFQLAGAPSVAASLWQVSDLATAALMIRFYREFAAGMPKDRALQAAQRAFLRDGVVGQEMQRPYWWAAFQIHGLP